YDQIPSYSLVKDAYDWGVWQEGVVLHRNLGVEAGNGGAGTAEGSGDGTTDKTDGERFRGEQALYQYTSGEVLLSGEDEYFHLADYPEYRSLGDPIESPYRAYIDFHVDADGS